MLLAVKGCLPGLLATSLFRLGSSVLDRENVDGLRAVWRASLDGSGVGPRSANQAQPLVYDGVVYIVTGDNDAFAIDVDRGWERLAAAILQVSGRSSGAPSSGFERRRRGASHGRFSDEPASRARQGCRARLSLKPR